MRPAGDREIAARVRAELGDSTRVRTASHPPRRMGGILNGPILAHEIEPLMHGVRRDRSELAEDRKLVLTRPITTWQLNDHFYFSIISTEGGGRLGF